MDAAGVAVEAVSRVYETAPREVEDQPVFLNAACRVRSDLSPPGLLAVAKRVERDLGREEGPRFGPRAIDVDLLLWEGGRWNDAHLEVPHPRLAERRFALVPLLEVTPPGAPPGGMSAAAALARLDAAEQPVAVAPGKLRIPGSCGG